MTTASGKSTISYFTWAFAFTLVGLALGGFLGWQTTGTIEGTATIFFICCVLAVLEISLSFDNAIVNANKLKTMTPEWQHRFLTWGIIIAVFGMRIIFPLLIVVIAAHLGPWEALKLAATQPAEYSRIMHEAHTPIAAFGGTFLMMVGLTYFFDQEKDIHWVRWIEEQASRYSSIRGVEVAVVLCAVLGFSRLLEGAEQQVFINSALYGLLTFLPRRGAGRLSRPSPAGARRGGQGRVRRLPLSRGARRLLLLRRGDRGLRP